MIEPENIEQMRQDRDEWRDRYKRLWESVTRREVGATELAMLTAENQMLRECNAQLVASEQSMRNLLNQTRS